MGSESAVRATSVAVVSTGGTITSLRAEDAEGLTAVLPLEALLRRAGRQHLASGRSRRGPRSGHQLERRPATQVGGRGHGRAARRAGRRRGVVVTRGTDTLEESALLVDVLVDTEKQVVFTAAMTATDEMSPDGPNHLRSAHRAAASPALNSLGTLACPDGRLQAARWVRKGHTHRTAALSSGTSPVATLDPDGVIRRMYDDLPRWTVPGGGAGNQPRSDDVPVPQAYSGMSARAAHVALVEATSPRGLVVDGFALGHVPESPRDAMNNMVAAGVVVVVSTRVPTGGTWEVYGGPGGGTDLAHLGVVGAGGLSAGKARLLLLACLADHDKTTARQLVQDGVTFLGRGAEGRTR